MSALTPTWTSLRRAPEPRLLTRGDYDRLLSAGNTAALLAHLALSPYAPAVVVARARHLGHRAIVEACRLHLGDALRSLRDMSGPGPSPIDILLARWDAANIRLILRGQNVGASVDEIVSGLVPAGDLADPELTELAATTTPSGLVTVLRRRHPIYAAIVAVSMRHAESDATLDDEVAARFHRWRLDAASGAGEPGYALLAWLAIEADAYNVALAHHSRGRREKAYLPGGTLETAALASVRGGDDAPLSAVLERAMSVLDAAADDCSVMSAAIRRVAAKEIEVEDVRWIASGIELGSTRSEIEAGLFGLRHGARRLGPMQKPSFMSYARGGP